MVSTSNTKQDSPKRIAFIQASWHRDIVDQCKKSFLIEIAKLCDHAVDVIVVPGAFEIPLQAKLLAKTGQYAAVIAAGLVTDSGIYRHEFVAQSVVSGLMQVRATGNRGAGILCGTHSSPIPQLQRTQYLL